MTNRHSWHRHSWHLGLCFLLLLATACGRSVPSSSSPGSSPAPGQGSQTPQTVAVTTVVSATISRELTLPGELTAHQEVMLSPKVSGFLERIEVDRGTVVRKGALLAQLSAPELGLRRVGEEADTEGARARRVEAEARVSSARAQRLAAEAQLAAAEATYRRLRGAAQVPGVIAGNELEQARYQVEAEAARVAALRALEEAAAAQRAAAAEGETGASATAKAARVTEDYLRIVAPFDGIITERFAHPGRLVHPADALLRLQQVTRLRLTVAVPEGEVARVPIGQSVRFSVPAFPGETFTGTIARPASAVDPTTRTMPVELDVLNPDRRLAPGMFPQVSWPANRTQPSLLVPPSAVAVTTERSFVVRLRNGKAEWVDVRKGIAHRLDGTDLIEVFGPLVSGETLALRGTDELRPGTALLPRTPPPQ